MSQQSEPGRPPAKQERGVDDFIRRRAERRRERLRAGIGRSRTGDHRVPTWVLAAVLVVIMAGWVYLVVSS